MSYEPSLQEIIAWLKEQRTGEIGVWAVNRDAMFSAAAKALEEMPNLDDYALCDCCGSYATSTSSDDARGNPLGHRQCAQCSRIAELETELADLRTKEKRNGP
jgi:hypothetical protein